VASLRVKSGPLAGHTIAVTDELVLGREGADVTIDDAEVSRRHAVVRRLDDVIEVEDLGSSNGTFVDDQRIEGPTRIGNGAKIRLGKTVLEVEGLSAAQATRVAAVAEPQATVIRRIPEPQVTRARSAAAAPIPPPALAAVPAGPFSPPARTRRRGLASRSWIPVVLSYGTVIVVAIALVIYFATR
jgi:predicted component of type VI protein secretion system